MSGYVDATNVGGKVVVITGAGSGMGEAAARHLAERGAIVVLGRARAVAFAISQPEDVDINEILFRPTRQEL